MTLCHKADVRAVLEDAEERLRAVGCESAPVDAELLLAHVLATTRSDLRANLKRTLSPGEADAFAQLVERRALREPVAYILGEWGFRRLLLTVDRRVLVPRPETEIVVERCLALLEGCRGPAVLDVGTGSGAIALAIAEEHPAARVTAIDSSKDALAVASENVARTGLAVELRRWDLFAGLPPGPWDLVVSNPPYVRPHELEGLEPEVRGWEPRDALVAEGATEAVAQGALSVLREGCPLVLEAAAAGASWVAELLRRLGYRDVRVSPDLTGRDRVVDGIAP